MLPRQRAPESEEPIATEVRLQYPMSHPEAVRRGLMFGVVFAAAPLLRGHVWQAVGVFLALGGAMFMVARHLLRTTVHTRGFDHHGWRHVEWADVADATIERGQLRLSLRGGEREMLPEFVLADPRFSECLQSWLSAEHPVRRAVEGARPVPP